MSTNQAMAQFQTEQAAAYERYVSENWDSLAPFEQEQAKAYLRAKFEAPQQSAFSAPPAASNSYGGQYGSAGYGQSQYASPGYGQSPYGYGDPIYGGLGLGAFAPPKRDEEEWAIWVGYLGVLFFTPLAIFCGIKNLTHDRPGHGWAQILLGIGPFVLIMMMLAA